MKEFTEDITEYTVELFTDVCLTKVVNYFKTQLHLLESGEVNEIRIPLLRPSQIEDTLEDEGFFSEENIEVNGWQWDYWWSFEKEGVEYSVSGDGYYNNYFTMSRKE